MIESLLIANRGEIARRIIRTARRMGIRTIAVYSQADAEAPFVREADVAIAIGGAAARDSYLNAARLLQAARDSGAAAIHPGYGFLSENAEFAEAVRSAGLVWVGAPPEAIRAMGLKDAAKRLMQAAGIPVTPGYLGDDQSESRLLAEADAIGYPVLIKAVAGGGGKGMRRVEQRGDFSEALLSCRREASAAFGDDRVLLEAYIQSPRHVEVQVFGDQAGQIVHLFERDCSLQRRHQKVIEEAPAPGLDPLVREFICSVAVKAARAVNYVGAGTIEFIADGSSGLRADRIWFMEMNTRLQVEHPVTEAITGQDLVEWQLRVASGEPLPRRQEELSIHGHAMEARLYAEDPASGFLPSIGKLRHLVFPAQVRVDTGVEQGGEVTAHYDPMIAKLIVHSMTRTGAARALASACAGVEVWPVHANAAFLARLASHPEFVAGRVDTGFIGRHASELTSSSQPGVAVLAAAAHALLPGPGGGPWESLTGLRLNGPAHRDVRVQVGQHTHVVHATDGAPALRTHLIDGEHIVFHGGEAFSFGQPDDGQLGEHAPVADGELRSPMPGSVLSVSASKGDRVAAGQLLITLEAMKMEYSLRAPFDGVVTDVRVAVGNTVQEGVTLMQMEKIGS